MDERLSNYKHTLFPEIKNTIRDVKDKHENTVQVCKTCGQKIYFLRR
jgi:hypothetical protein